MDLPESIASAIEPLFSALPLDWSMAQLVVSQGATLELVQLVEGINQSEALAGHAALQAALWLYIDELDCSHTLAQGIKDSTGSYWHGIMHRREGDFSNSHYWFRNTGDHPAMPLIDGYDGHRFIDAVEARHASGADDLVDLQRLEWSTLFAWSAHKD
jgi:hypothetical protein